LCTNTWRARWWWRTQDAEEERAELERKLSRLTAEVRSLNQEKADLQVRGMRCGLDIG